MVIAVSQWPGLAVVGGMVIAMSQWSPLFSLFCYEFDAPLAKNDLRIHVMYIVSKSRNH